jgi:hypothetical protein
MYYYNYIAYNIESLSQELYLSLFDYLYINIETEKDVVEKICELITNE